MRIKKVTGEEIDTYMVSGWTLADLQSEVQDRFSIPTSNQVLLFRNKKISGKPEATLESLGITDADEIVVLGNAKGAGLKVSQRDIEIRFLNSRRWMRCKLQLLRYRRWMLLRDCMNE
jgi:hypothetical protein